MIATLIIFTILNILLSFFDAHKIIKGKWIKHGVNAAIYLAMVLVPYLVFHNWILVVALLFNRLIFFNSFLSLFRGLPYDYMPLKPLSITDIWAKKVFGLNGVRMYITYSIIFVILTVLLFVI